jgi:tRNA(Phe) wybutosine-synthesizing methylase Tyw3
MGQWQAPADLDPECLRLCTALNTLDGIRTIESCCGHGDYPYRIWVVADSLDALTPLAYWLMMCHCGVPDWRLIVGTDCGMSAVKFMVEGPIGDEAYAQANVIAEFIGVREPATA